MKILTPAASAFLPEGTRTYTHARQAQPPGLLSSQIQTKQNI